MYVHSTSVYHTVGYICAHKITRFGMGKIVPGINIFCALYFWNHDQNSIIILSFAFISDELLKYTNPAKITTLMVFYLINSVTLTDSEI